MWVFISIRKWSRTDRLESEVLWGFPNHESSTVRDVTPFFYMVGFFPHFRKICGTRPTRNQATSFFFAIFRNKTDLARCAAVGSQVVHMAARISSFQLISTVHCRNVCVVCTAWLRKGLWCCDPMWRSFFALFVWSIQLVAATGDQRGDCRRLKFANVWGGPNWIK